MTNWDRETLRGLYETLASLYWQPDDARRLTKEAGLNPSMIDISGSPINMWFKVVDYAEHSERVDSVVAVAFREHPDHEGLKEALAGAPARPPAERQDTIEWSGPTGDRELEKIIGAQSMLVPVSHLQVGLNRSRSVVRVKRASGESGSGFVTGSNILVTNHHVLPDEDAARDAVLQFNYQQTVAGLDTQIEEANLLSDIFFKTSKKDDWTAVRIEGEPSVKWGSLVLTPATVKKGDHVNIIQHPGGGPKQISLVANVVAYVGDGRVQYLTDTLPGSSGSPVFDVNWNVVALHHSGGWLPEPGANRISKTTYYRNEGILIDRVIDGMAE